MQSCVMNVNCYGSLVKAKHLHVYCEDDWADGMHDNLDPNTGKPFVDWDVLITLLSQHYNSKILEIYAA